MPIKLPALFCDQLVLQRETPAPVWGWAEPGEAVRVRIAGQDMKTTAGNDGRWQVCLAPMSAGGPYELVVEGKTKKVLKEVLVGDVWICSGQSNMELPVSKSANAEREIEEARYPKIRLFTVDHSAVVEPRQDVNGCWTVCEPRTIETFSAAAYYFGRYLHQQLNIPIGLIHTSWGGTIAEAWTSRESLLAEPMFRKRIEEYERKLPAFEAEQVAYLEKVKEGEEKYYPADPGNKGFGLGWADPAADVSNWEQMNVPRMWQSAGLNFSGVIWFRKEVEIPASWAGKPLTLNLCPCDKHDTTYFNNVAVGGMGREKPDAWCTPRCYPIPGHLVKAGRNVIAVRIYSYAFAGGFIGPNQQLNLAPAGHARGKGISLSGPWQYQVEHNFGTIQSLSSFQPLGPGHPGSPYSLHRGMIAPLIPYAIKGAIWYQGESNANRADEYRTLFPLMIRDWRRAWNQGDFPFLFVQLANYQQSADSTAGSLWAELREAQTLALRLPYTGMAVAIDIGDAWDIHPQNKQEVGRRLALAALHSAYGRNDLAWSGPMFKKYEIKGKTIRISFDHADGGLVSRDGKLTGFAVSGADRYFVPARAKIEAEQVVVSSSKVPQPAAVRYAWADNPIGNLYNGAGLPSSPFRTDDWPGMSAPSA